MTESKILYFVKKTFKQKNSFLIPKIHISANFDVILKIAFIWLKLDEILLI